MTTWTTRSLVALSGMILLGQPALALTDLDTADDPVYADGWNDLDDGSSVPGAVAGGLGGWVMGGNAIDGTTIDIETSANVGAASGIDTAGVSFKLHDTTGGFVDIFRFFDPAGLDVGQTFSMQMQVNYRGGFKGIDIRGDTAGDPTIFNFNIGGDDYTVDHATTGNGSIGNAYSNDTVFTLDITQTSLAGGTWSITRSGGISDFDTGTYAGRARSFKLYAGSLGTFAEDAFYVNNFSVDPVAIPQPASAALAAVGALLITRRRRHA